MKKVKPPILRPDEEEEILKKVINKARAGEPIQRQDVIKQVVKFIMSDKRKNPFRNGSPGDKWFSLFRRRHNHHFLKLEPSMLSAVEKIGFTEKVMNTVTYPRSPVIHRREVLISAKKSYRRSSSTLSGVNLTPTPPPPPQSQPPPPPPVVACSPASEESSNATEDGDTCKSQGSHSEAGDFRPGSKLEVMDFNEKWYPVKVVEVDYEEGEVLVHFEKWSDRYDEWVRMDSNRIRRPQLPPSTSKKVFVENEKVIAVWAYNHRYPATVRKVLPNEKYEVLFCDGYPKVLRGCKLFKATEEDLKKVQLPPPKKPAPPMGADPLDPDLGPKEERRLKKRRLDVLEAYRPQKKQRMDPSTSTPDSSPQPTTSHSSKETPKVVLRMRGRPPKRSKKRLEEDDDDDEDDNKYIDDDDDDDNDDDDDDNNDADDDVELDNSESERPKSAPIQVHTIRRGRRKKKKPFDESKYMYRGPKQRSGFEEDAERWNMEIPEGAAPVQIKDQEGYYRESIIIPDKKMPPGWTKHTMRRKSGAKWDVFLVNPAGRKFRSRNELRNYYAELKIPFPEESFDFMVGRKMEMIRTQTENRKKLQAGQLLNRSLPILKSSSAHKKEGRSVSKKAAGERDLDSRRIKTLLPKSRHLGSAEDLKQESQTPSPVPPKIASPPFPLTELRTPDGGFTCCGKTFRKENLFQMHMKHYHPEYSNLFGSTPNVADLAYARTVGEPLEDSRAEAMTPKNTLIERVNKYEADRKALTDMTPVSLEATTTTIKSVEKKEANAEPLKEEPDAPVLENTKDQDPFSSVKEEVTNDSTAAEQSIESEKMVEASEERHEELTKKTEYVGPLLPVPDNKPEHPEEKTEEPTPNVMGKEPPPTPAQPLPALSPPPPPPPPAPPAVSSIPVIRPVSRLTSGTSKISVTPEAVIVQTTASPKTPVTITKYVPPGSQKPSSSLTKLTISMSEKEGKPTIKTLLPQRPPPPTPPTLPPLPPSQEPKELQDIPKPKEVKLTEETEVEIQVKCRPRKRTVSESLPKKAKLVKLTTGSLEEEPVAETPQVAESPSANTASYRFSRNRAQIPCVSIEKLNITPDSNGRVVLSTPEDKYSNTSGRRQFKNFKAGHKLSKKHKGSVVAGLDIPSGGEQPAPLETQDVIYENLRKEEIINCTCGYMEEDGLMIQCDLCLCWQHGLCNNIDKESDVPEKYVCYICQHPARQRLSMRHLNNQDWLKDGKLPSFSFRPKNEESIVQREAMLKKSHELVASLLQLRTVIRSLRVKTHIATKPDHPKLYLWAKSWKNDSPESEDDSSKQEGVSGPQPEAAIDETECRMRLLEHVEDYQHQVDDRLTSIQAQIAALESEDPDLANDEASDHYPVTKQTVQMLLRDLDTVRKVAAIN